MIKLIKDEFEIWCSSHPKGLMHNSNCKNPLPKNSYLGLDYDTSPPSKRKFTNDMPPMQIIVDWRDKSENVKHFVLGGTSLTKPLVDYDFRKNYGDWRQIDMCTKG
tara:strand:+ start:376 stop:693 length:318 start_codon:yes stop_codon:yes gene_type:complete